MANGNKPVGRIVAKGKRGSSMEGEYVNLGTVWPTDWEETDSISFQNRQKDDSGNWDNYPVKLVATLSDGSEVEVTNEDFFINFKHAEDNF